MFGGTSRLMVTNMIDRIGGIILIWRLPGGFLKLGYPQIIQFRPFKH